jgi:hypothetical protein
VDLSRPELLTQGPFCISNNQRTIFINFHHDFVSSVHSDFYQGDMDRVLVYYFNQSGKTLLPSQEEEDVTLLEWRMTLTLVTNKAVI